MTNSECPKNTFAKLPDYVQRRLAERERRFEMPEIPFVVGL